jgi:hypothetical protein
MPAKGQKLSPAHKRAIALGRKRALKEKKNTFDAAVRAEVAANKNGHATPNDNPFTISIEVFGSEAAGNLLMDWIGRADVGRVQITNNENNRHAQTLGQRGHGTLALTK